MVKQRTILLVDDSNFLAHMVQLYLKPPDYRLLTAPDGVSALRMIEEQKPDAVLLDIVMPKMDGLETCRRIKENEKTRGVKVAIVTAIDTPAERRKALELGADDYLVKPTDPFEIVKAIKKLLERI